MEKSRVTRYPSTPSLQVLIIKHKKINKKNEVCKGHSMVGIFEITSHSHYFFFNLYIYNFFKGKKNYKN